MDGGEARIEGQQSDLGANTMVSMPPGAVHGYRFEPGTDGLVLTLGIEILDEVLIAQEGLAPILSRPQILFANREIRQVMQEIARDFGSRRFARAHVLRARIALVAGLVARAAEALGETGARDADDDLTRRFLSLLDQNYARHWRLHEYATALAVSTRHLTRLLKTSTGQPASKLIEERLVREARRMLVYTNLPISQIAYELGFSDPAYFSRVFARATGRSPRAFRSSTE